MYIRLVAASRSCMKASKGEQAIDLRYLGRFQFILQNSEHYVWKEQASYIPILSIYCDCKLESVKMARVSCLALAQPSTAVPEESV